MYGVDLLDYCFFGAGGLLRNFLIAPAETPSEEKEAAGPFALPEQTVRQGPFGSLYQAMQPAGQAIVQLSWPGAVQVFADEGKFPSKRITETANNHFIKAHH
jgi:hypothetical protein